MIAGRTALIQKNRFFGPMLLLAASLALIACERTPTDYSTTPQVSTRPVARVVLEDAVQTIAVNGLTIASFPVLPTNVLDADSVIAMIGRIDETDEGIHLHLDLDVSFPKYGVNVLRGFDQPQMRGFGVEIDSLAIPSEDLGYHTSEGCPNTRGSLAMARLTLDTTDCTNPKYVWSEESTIPATVEIRLQHHADTETGGFVDGTIELRTTLRTPSGALLFYDFVGRLTID